MSWIPITQSKPPPDKLVLVKGESGYITHPTFYTSAYYDPTRPLSDYWHDISHDPLSSSGLWPTHWRALTEIDP